LEELTKLLLNGAALIVIGCLVVFVLFMQRVTVDTNAMAPTLVYGDEVLVWKGAEIARTDVAVCPHPVRTEQWIFGRTIAFAGERVTTDLRGTLTLDSDRLPTNFEGTRSFYDVTLRKQSTMAYGLIDFGSRYSHPFFLEKGYSLRIEPFVVNQGIYLLGDNRSFERYDSREVGEIDPESCLGQVVLRWKKGPPTGDDLDHGRFDIIE
jgi:signal peptidase I